MMINIEKIIFTILVIFLVESITVILSRHEKPYMKYVILFILFLLFLANLTTITKDFGAFKDFAYGMLIPGLIGFFSGFATGYHFSNIFEKDYAHFMEDCAQIHEEVSRVLEEEEKKLEESNHGDDKTE